LHPNLAEKLPKLALEKSSCDDFEVVSRAVPFINVCFPDDGATLLTLDEAIQRTPYNLRFVLATQKATVVQASVGKTKFAPLDCVVQHSVPILGRG
jgi:hypothetical protein